ncbi:hypothetical protein [Agarilytica rhodophyticola]|uniref:hypothetical protein n=1 Tax=Agarilytica rhodophyticola TaxID=1737490 RepID=UPI000B347DAB|nr:hypothetical protein [Agarilytica rhodophyticola]
MKIYNECLNDLMDYFILADIYHLSEFAETNELSDNLMCEFTSNQSGDKAVNEGIILPICGIENYPYIVCFNMSAPSIFFCLQR